MSLRQKQRDELKRVLLAPERHERNILKLCEEMAELQEVLLKYVNKREDARPPVSKIIEELGDVIFRGQVIADQFDIEENVNERIEEKEEQVYNYYLTKQMEKA
jgi:NTP pyrophosphatase (non-canonical NTP hydrolase)